MLDVKNALYSHFLAKTTFSVREDAKLVGLGHAYDARDGVMSQYKLPLLRAALDDMVKVGILLALDQEAGVYMLTAPLLSFNQQVVISPYTANLVADAFNYFARTTGGTPHVANKLAITDVEINTVAQIVFAFRDEADELHDMLGGEGDDGENPPMGGFSPGGTPGIN